jgi:hypothetical protein
MSAGITAGLVGTALVGAAATGIVGSLLAPSGSSGAPSGTGAGANAAGAADPFAAQRGQYQTQLNNMMAPGAVFNSSDPSYGFRFNQGATALDRSQNANGNMGSGAQMAAATQYGQQQASQEYGNQFSRLSQLAGANIGSPAAAGQIMQGQQQQQQAGATALGATVGGLATTAMTNYMNAPAPTPGAATDPLAMGQTSTFGQPTPASSGGATSWMSGGSGVSTGTNYLGQPY